MNNQVDINQIIGNIIALHDSGGDPNKMMQEMFQRNPNINQMSTQYQNMTQGRSRKDVIMQLAKQRGLNEQNIQGLMRILGVK